MDVLEYTTAKLLQTLQQFPLVNTYFVAFSGGMDSHVLLHSIAVVKDELHCDIVAIHINHGLHGAAQSWAEHCQNVCDQLGVTLITRNITSSCPKGESIEAWARKERYQLFRHIVTEKNMLLTAQHKDDQAETLLLQMFRGGGVKGLSSMPALKGFNHAYHARPLLQYTRSELAAYANAHNLQWIEDESNQNTAHDRNFIRQRLIPVIEEKWPRVTDTLSRVAKHFVETNQLLAELARIDLEDCGEKEPRYLNATKLRRLPVPRQKNIIRYWLDANGVMMPSSVKLDHIINDVVASSVDAQPELTVNDVVIRRYKDMLMLTQQIDVANVQDRFDWDLNKPCQLPLGVLTAMKVNGEGIDCAACTNNRIEVRFRKGGERIQPRGSKQHKELKNILQENKFFPWLRDSIPLLYLNDELVSIAGFCNDQTYSVKNNQQGWKIEWSALDEARI